MKKNLFKFLVCAFALVLLLSSCSGEMFEDDEIRGYTVTMLDAIIADDYDTAYETISDACREQEFAAFYNQARAAFEGVKTYELTRIGYNSTVNVNNGEQIKRTDAEYKFKSGNIEYVITVSTMTGYKNLAGFHIGSIEKTDLYYNGTLDNMVGATPFQWVMLLLNLVVAAVTIFAIVDCARRNIKKKALWIVIIVLGMLIIGKTTTANASQLNFNLGMFSYSAFIIYGSGKTVFRLLVPVGAIVYLAMRKTLEKQAYHSENPLVPPYMQAFTDEQPQTAQPISEEPAPEETTSEQTTSEQTEAGEEAAEDSSFTE